MKRVFHSIILWICFSTTLLAQAGILDSSFADDGIFIWDIEGGHDNPGSMDIQEDGKMVFVLAATFSPASNVDVVIVRLNQDGTRDSTFAVNGLYHYSNPVSFDIGYHIQVLDDGKILAAGAHGTSATNPDLLLIKLNSNGTPDSTFGNNGVVIHAVGPDEDYARSFVITTEGKIVVAGQSQSSVSDFYRRNVVCRFNANGVIDSTFADNGVFLWNDNMTSNGMNSVAIADDGNIIASGTGVPSGTDRLTIYKILEDGSALDTTFGNNGEVLAPYGSEATGMIIHSNGKILLTGTNYNVNGQDLLVLAYHQNGTPDLDFGQDGAFLINIDVNDKGVSLMEQQDGKIIAAGNSGGAFQQGNPGAFLSVRMDEMGVLDTSWGGDGYVITPMPSGIGAVANDVAIQADGKVVLAGVWANIIPGNDMLVMRYGNFIDQDEDGYGIESDCNDLEFAINPGVDETPYNGLDDDCDPTTPDDDLDGDGFNLVDDCDDEDAAINPDAIEIYGNEIDENCDGLLVGINEPALAQQFSLYPNPTMNNVYIDFSMDAPAIEFIELNDYTGKKIGGITTQHFHDKVAVNLSGLPQGLFLLTIHTLDGLVVKRILKK